MPHGDQGRGDGGWGREAALRVRRDGRLGPGEHRAVPTQKSPLPQAPAATERVTLQGAGFAPLPPGSGRGVCLPPPPRHWRRKLTGGMQRRGAALGLCPVSTMEVPRPKCKAGVGGGRAQDLPVVRTRRGLMEAGPQARGPHRRVCAGEVGRGRRAARWGYLGGMRAGALGSVSRPCRGVRRQLEAGVPEQGRGGKPGQGRLSQVPGSPRGPPPPRARPPGLRWCPHRWPREGARAPPTVPASGTPFPGRIQSGNPGPWAGGALTCWGGPLPGPGVGGLWAWLHRPPGRSTASRGRAAHPRRPGGLPGGGSISGSRLRGAGAGLGCGFRGQRSPHPRRAGDRGPGPRPRSSPGSPAGGGRSHSVPGAEAEGRVRNGCRANRGINAGWGRDASLVNIYEALSPVIQEPHKY